MSAYDRVVREDFRSLNQLMEVLHKRPNNRCMMSSHSSNRDEPSFFGTKNYAAGTFTVYRRETQQVVIDDPQSIPAEFMKIKVTETPNKTLIKESIKAGAEVSGAHIQTNQSISIK